jgi:hypothetical protein
MCVIEEESEYNHNSINTALLAKFTSHELVMSEVSNYAGSCAVMLWPRPDSHNVATTSSLRLPPARIYAGLCGRSFDYKPFPLVELFRSQDFSIAIDYVWLTIVLIYIRHIAGCLYNLLFIYR